MARKRGTANKIIHKEYPQFHEKIINRTLKQRQKKKRQRSRMLTQFELTKMATYLRRDWKYCFEVVGALRLDRTRPSESFSMTLFHKKNTDRTHNLRIVSLTLSQRRYRQSKRSLYTQTSLNKDTDRTHHVQKYIQSHALPTKIRRQQYWRYQ